MKLTYVTDSRIAETAVFKVAEHPNYPGYYGVFDTDFMELIADGFDLEACIQLAVERNDSWNNFVDDLIG